LDHESNETHHWVTTGDLEESSEYPERAPGGTTGGAEFLDPENSNDN